MRILLTNDDGVLSPVLYRAADALAGDHEVIIAAPANDQSGKSHSFTHGVGKLLTYQQDGAVPYTLYRVDGTPSDCVKFAVSHLLRDRRPDLVISGPNLGENAGVSAIYSGTVAAAREAALWNIPALAVSLSEESDAHVEFALEWLRKLLLDPRGLPTPGTIWNVNFPGCSPDKVAGARFAPMGTAMFSDHYVEAPLAHGIVGYQLRGRKPAGAFAAGSDDDVLRHGYVSIAPLQISQTHEAELARLNSREAWLNALTSSPAAEDPA